MIYHYSVFDFYIQSEVPLVAFRTVEPKTNPQIIVKEGSVAVPKDNLPDTVYTELMTYNSTMCYQRLKEGTGAYIIHKKETHTEVILDFIVASERQTLLAYFYGTGLSAILHLNDQFALHASGVLTDGKLVLFCGRSGIGKSTLAAYLKSQGHELFADDKCVISKQGNDDNWYAYPSLQIMRLWDDALTEIPTAEFLTDPVPVVMRQDKQQYRIQEQDLVQGKVPLACIFILTNSKVDSKLNYQLLEGVTKLRFLQAQIFRKHMIKGFSKELILWNFLSKLASDTKIFIIQRPKETPPRSFGKFIQETISEVVE